MYDYEIVNHGIEHAQYFQGCGIACTKYDFCVTGVGYTAQEAYEDALDQISILDGSFCNTFPAYLDELLQGPFPAVSAQDIINEDNEVFYYLSIRWKAKDNNRSGSLDNLTHQTQTRRTKMWEKLVIEKTNDVYSFTFSFLPLPTKKVTIIVGFVDDTPYTILMPQSPLLFLVPYEALAHNIAKTLEE